MKFKGRNDRGLGIYQATAGDLEIARAIMESYQIADKADRIRQTNEQLSRIFPGVRLHAACRDVWGMDWYSAKCSRRVPRGRDGVKFRVSTDIDGGQFAHDTLESGVLYLTAPTRRSTSSEVLACVDIDEPVSSDGTTRRHDKQKRRPLRDMLNMLGRSRKDFIGFQQVELQGDNCSFTTDAIVRLEEIPTMRRLLTRAYELFNNNKAQGRWDLEAFQKAAIMMASESCEHDAHYNPDKQVTPDVIRSFRDEYHRQLAMCLI